VTTPPIACTLDPAQMPQRGDEIREPAMHDLAELFAGTR
jgi:surfactin synthase thioesterase subunit